MVPPLSYVRWAYAGCAAAGVLQALSLAVPWAEQPSALLQLVSLALFASLLERARHLRQAAGLAWTFATAWLCVTFWWLFTALHTYGSLPALLAVLAVLSLAAALSLYHAAAMALYHSLKPRAGWGRACLFGALWMAAELARSVWFTGFGWGGVAYAHLEGVMSAWAPWVGAHGMAALIAALAMGMAHLRPKLGISGVHVLIAVCVLPWAAKQLVPESATWTRSSGTISVLLLQGNIAQNEKFEQSTGVPEALSWYGDMLKNGQADVVVAPETALPLLPEQLPPDYWAALRERFASGERAAMIGMPLGSFVEGYTNAVIGLVPTQKDIWRYDKHHLVPFGEFIPPMFRWFTELMNIPLGDFNRGAINQPSLAWKGQRLAANICFEDLFGEELARRFLVEQPPTLFVNVSNMAWFGRSQAPDQHLAISRLRALEFQRPFVRATNTGMTAAINHHGVVHAQLPRFERGSLAVVVEGREGMTPYASWVARAGLWPCWLLALAVVGLAWRARPEQPEAP